MEATMTNGIIWRIFFLILLTMVGTLGIFWGMIEKRNLSYEGKGSAKVMIYILYELVLNMLFIYGLIQVLFFVYAIILDLFICVISLFGLLWLWVDHDAAREYSLIIITTAIPYVFVTYLILIMP